MADADRSGGGGVTAAAIAAGVSGANFPLRNTLRHDAQTFERAGRAGRTDLDALPGESWPIQERSPSDPSACRSATHDAEPTPNYMPSFGEHESSAQDSATHEHEHDLAHEETHESVASRAVADEPAEHRPAARDLLPRLIPVRESFPRRNEGFRAPHQRSGTAARRIAFQVEAQADVASGAAAAMRPFQTRSFAPLLR